MNRDKKIGWTDWTLNSFTGCSRRCNYCYAFKFAKRLAGRYGYPKENPFQCILHENRFDEPSKISKKFISKNPNLPLGSAMIFTGSMGELFDPTRPVEEVYRVFNAIEKYPQHRFQILTKNPELAWELEIPNNAWIGVSINKMDELCRVADLAQIEATMRFISFEPLHSLIVTKEIIEGKTYLYYPARFKKMDWFIVGAETGNRKEKITPKKEWIQSIINISEEYEIPIFMKDNLKPYWNEELIQQFPLEL